MQEDQENEKFLAVMLSEFVNEKRYWGRNKYIRWCQGLE